MKRETCAEVIASMRQKVEGYPVLLKKAGSSKEIMAISDGDKAWDLYIYQSHGFIFTRVVKGLSHAGLAKLERELIAF